MADPEYACITNNSFQVEHKRMLIKLLSCFTWLPFFQCPNYSVDFNPQHLISGDMTGSALLKGMGRLGSDLYLSAKSINLYLCAP